MRKEMEMKSVRSEAKAPLIINVFFSSFFKDLFFFSNQKFTAVDPNDPFSIQLISRRDTRTIQRIISIILLLDIK